MFHLIDSAIPLLKEERKQIFLKEKAQKDKEEAEKAAKSQKNPYSVFSKNDEEDEMEDDSVVFTVILQ